MFFYKQKKETKKKEKETNSIDEIVESEHKHLIEKIVGVIYIIFIIVITLLVLLELKMEYQIDIFPGINSPFDDVYRELKDEFQNPDGLPENPNTPY
ncbi:MAG: hypothetical protein MH472_00750 [Bacteroidia bacterium]|nr:hypothetical protein [Bacteroidia bacterium]